MRRARFVKNKYRVIDVKFLTPDTYQLRTERPNVPIRAGQCFNVGVPGHGINREYSMYSATDAPHVDFLIRKVDHGMVSVALSQVKPGDVVEVDGPYGEFVLRPSGTADHRYMFIATGTGIAPFHSYALSFPELKYTLVHGIRDLREQYHFEDYESGSYVACVARNEDGRRVGRVTDYLRANPVDPRWCFYLCGNRSMIVDAFEILREQGVPGDNLFTEVFF